MRLVVMASTGPAWGGGGVNPEPIKSVQEHGIPERVLKVLLRGTQLIHKAASLSI